MTKEGTNKKKKRVLILPTSGGVGYDGWKERDYFKKKPRVGDDWGCRKGLKLSLFWESRFDCGCKVA